MSLLEGNDEKWKRIFQSYKLLKLRIVNVGVDDGDDTELLCRIQRTSVGILK